MQFLSNLSKIGLDFFVNQTSVLVFANDNLSFYLNKSLGKIVTKITR